MEKQCNGVHCRCMDIGGACPNMHGYHCKQHNPNAYEKGTARPVKSNEQNGWEKEFDRRFDNYAYVAELYVEAQMGDLNMLSLKDFIRNLLTTQELSLRKEWAGKVRELEEIEKAAKPADDEEKLYEFGYLVACKQIRAIIEPDSTK